MTQYDVARAQRSVSQQCYRNVTFHGIDRFCDSEKVRSSTLLGPGTYTMKRDLDTSSSRYKTDFLYNRDRVIDLYGYRRNVVPPNAYPKAKVDRFGRQVEIQEKISYDLKRSRVQ